MASEAKIAERLSDLVRQTNRKFASDALLCLVLGIIFSLLTFGLVFWIGWYAAIFSVRNIGIPSWQVGIIFAGLFFIVAVWSAWRRVNPLADLQPLSEKQQMHRLVSMAVGLTYFSPRHVLAGAAMVLIGGPANVFQALGIWMHRLRHDDPIISEATSLLMSSEPLCPIEEIREIESAVLLKRLALIKIIPNGESHALTLTEKGRKILGNRKIS